MAPRVGSNDGSLRMAFVFFSLHLALIGGTQFLGPASRPKKSRRKDREEEGDRDRGDREERRGATQLGPRMAQVRDDRAPG